ncbi:TonB-dependent hemoglobin/transferrin/lactoferrin family receptor [Haemophilus influenzae]|uniref:TonB-dependent hemoglobin/transferrin/lactoferrin family receptor n=1 Tax=Haemophilus influenzae TaxID=727 RepID=UPI000DD43831|nr:TonB-dependent hemoglobin/transferrin/lactoferrin family receptor [Haemophilus influenzae]
MANFRLNVLAYSVMLGLTAGVAYAAQPTNQDGNLSEQLEQINVSGSTENSDTKTPPKIAETVKTAKTLEREQANNIKDIVKYETGVTVVEAGRFGQSGFAIRGVDENRVAINIDGLRQAETLSSQGFKELFEGYGNFNNTRNGAEIETLKEVNITKGANSIKSGSGSLGGSVIYKTKDARDYLLNKDYYVSYKKGYATENNQSFNTLTLAGRYKKFDVLVVTTSRNGHELENYGYKNYNDKIQGKKREKADPYKIEQDSTLLKLSFNPTENHRFTLAADLYEHRSRGQDLSYTLKYLKTLPDLLEDDSRHTNDKTKRRNISFSYENFSQTPFWDTLKITFSKQKIKTRARTDEYCDAGVRYCERTANPAGLKLTDGKITRRDGSKLEFEKENTGDYYNFNRFIDTDGKVIENKLKLGNANDTWYDCSLFDCEKDKKIQVFEGERSYGHKGKWKESELEIENLNGKKFARIKKNDRDNNKIKSILPSSPGYLERLWQERDLDTNTQQLNLDLTKDFKTWRVEHNLQYGSSYNTTMKRMVNRAGNDATDVQWWAERTLGFKTSWYAPAGTPETCEGSYTWNAFLCPRVDPEFSFLLPIKTKEKSVYLFDNVVITDYLSFDLGYRYDNIHYQPKYKHGVTPKLPDDIVKGLFIPLPNGKHNNDDEVKKNVKQNIDYIAKQNKKYKAHSYSFVSTIDPTSFLRLQLKYSKGFRAPTSDEMYFTFKHPDFTILPNTNLKPEIAKTKEIAFTLHNDDWGFISTSLFKTNYKNFIDLVYKGTQSFKLVSGGDTLPFSLYQNINRDSAVVKGIEINSKVFLGKMAKFMDGFNLSYKYTYQKGRMDGNIPMNAIQPKTMVYGLGYDHPSQKFGFNFYTTHVATKNPEDTYDIYAKDKRQTDTSIKWRSKSYTILDLIGYVQPIKNLTIRAGVYNLTNRKYITWDSARSIRSFGTSNVIDQSTGLGINRFYAPGRNYKMSVQFEF